MGGGGGVHNPFDIFDSLFGGGAFGGMRALTGISCSILPLPLPSFMSSIPLFILNY